MLTDIYTLLLHTLTLTRLAGLLQFTVRCNIRDSHTRLQQTLHNNAAHMVKKYDHLNQILKMNCTGCHVMPGLIFTSCFRHIKHLMTTKHLNIWLTYSLRILSPVRFTLQINYGSKAHPSNWVGYWQSPYSKWRQQVHGKVRLLFSLMNYVITCVLSLQK